MAFNAHPKIGAQTIKKALHVFDDDPKKLWEANDKKINSRLDNKIASLVLEAKEKYSPEQEIKKLEKYNIGYLTIYDKSYPQLLKEIPDAPAVLYIKGKISTLSLSAISIVGSRKFTSYGKSVAHRLASECSQRGLSIVSGLALGIDAISHWSAVELNNPTVAVLACGLDKIYPSSNSDLARKILFCGGAIISENPPGTPPLKQNFPARNRIIAGLTLGTLVIEAAERSGALITAYEALEYNREVFAVPGNINSLFSVGTNKLIQKGAKLVLNVEDILSEINFELKESITRAKKILPVNDEEKVILKILNKEELPVDKIIAKSGFNIIKINTILTMMEMKGMLENVGGGIYRRKL